MYSPEPQWRFPKTFLDRLDVLTIDGHVLDAASWNVKRLIWRPDMRLEEREVDFGPRSGNPYAGPGWSLERREADGNSQQTTFVQALTSRAIVAVSLPTGAAELVLRAASPAGAGPKAMHVDVDGRSIATLNPSTRDGYRDLIVTIPPDPSRPPISHITLRFDAGDRADFVFKLDRMEIR